MSRASIVGVLVAVEVLVVGMILYVVAGSHGVLFDAGMHRVDFAAASIEPIAAGAAPHVAIDDSASRVTVKPSSDGLVHAKDLTQIRGTMFSKSTTYPHLQMTRTSDGVRIGRAEPNGLSLNVFGSSRQAIEVDVPPGAHVEIARCSGADVTGIAGGVSAHSIDGHVALTDVRGSVDVHSDDGSVRAHAISLTGNGRSELSTDDGSIELDLTPGANLTIDASTGDGRIVADGATFDGDDSVRHTIRLGTGTGSLKLATSDGSIHINTNGAL